MPGKPPVVIRLYRIVHLQNVEYILRNGMYTRQSPHFDTNYIDIGDSQLITQRHDYPVKLQGFGNLGEYVPFYFAGHSPMLLNIKTGFRGITKRPQYEIVYIVCKLDDILAHCIEKIVVKDNPRKQIIDKIIKNLNLSTSVQIDTQNRLYYYD